MGEECSKAGVLNVVTADIPPHPQRSVDRIQRVLTLDRENNFSFIFTN